MVAYKTPSVTLIRICGAQWFSPYVSAKVSGPATSRSRLGLCLSCASVTRSSWRSLALKDDV